MRLTHRPHLFLALAAAALTAACLSDRHIARQ